MKRHRTKCLACGRVYRVRYNLGRAYPAFFGAPYCRPCRKPKLEVAG